METDTPDEDLVPLVAQGSLEAFEQLVLRHQQRAWHLSGGSRRGHGTD